jgi:hypothetical protein
VVVVSGSGLYLMRAFFLLCAVWSINEMFAFILLSRLMMIVVGFTTFVTKNVFAGCRARPWSSKQIIVTLLTFFIRI